MNHHCSHCLDPGVVGVDRCNRDSDGDSAVGKGVVVHGLFDSACTIVDSEENKINVQAG